MCHTWWPAAVNGDTEQHLCSFNFFKMYFSHMYCVSLWRSFQPAHPPEMCIYLDFARELHAWTPLPLLMIKRLKCRWFREPRGQFWSWDHCLNGTSFLSWLTCVYSPICLWRHIQRIWSYLSSEGQLFEVCFEERKRLQICLFLSSTSIPLEHLIYFLKWTFRFCQV